MSKLTREAENDAVHRCLERVVRHQFAGSQRTAAERLGVSQAYVSDVMNRRRGGGRKLVGALADYLRVPVDEVLGRSAESQAFEHSRSPHRARAILLAAELLGISTDLAERLAPVFPRPALEPSTLWWFDQIRAAFEVRERGARFPDWT